MKSLLTIITMLLSFAVFAQVSSADNSALETYLNFEKEKLSIEDNYPNHPDIAILDAKMQSLKASISKAQIDARIQDLKTEMNNQISNPNANEQTLKTYKLRIEKLEAEFNQ